MTQQSLLSKNSSTIVWTCFVAVLAADAILPGPSFAVLCLPVFFAFLALVNPRYPWPFAIAAACVLVGAWLLEQGLQTGASSEPLANYRLVDRLILSVGILLASGVHPRIQLIHDKIVDLGRGQVSGSTDPGGPALLASLRRTVLAASTLTLVAVFLIDAVSPRNVNMGALYLLPVYWASALERPGVVLAFLLPAAGLSGAGYFLGPSSTVLPIPGDVLLERLISIGVLLVTAVVLSVYSFLRRRKRQSSHSVVQ